MVDRGLREVSNPSELFLGNREVAPGTALVVACEDSIVVELQALVSPTSYCFAATLHYWH